MAEDLNGGDGDLHIHAPGTALNDQFGSWDEYLDEIEAADPRIAVIGVTDYLTLRSYKKLLAYREAGPGPRRKVESAAGAVAVGRGSSCSRRLSP